MLKNKLEKKIEERMEALLDIMDIEIQSLCEAKSIIETIYYLNYLTKKENAE